MSKTNIQDLMDKLQQTGQYAGLGEQASPDTISQGRPAPQKKKYSQVVQEQRAKDEAKTQQSQQDSAPSTASTAASAGQAALSAKASGQGALGAAGAGMSAAGAMMAMGKVPSPASPYLIGGGLALSTLDAARQMRQQQNDAEAEARNQTIKKQQEILNSMAQMFMPGSVM